MQASSEAARTADGVCPLLRAADVVGDRWTLLILRHALTGVTRFDGFRGELGIADNILSNRLGRLVAAGLLTKVPYRDGGRTRQEYRLTEAGADMLPVLNALTIWGLRHGEGVATMHVLHEPCGRDLDHGDYCEHCGRYAPREEIRWLRPWRSPEPVPIAEPLTQEALP